jgi:hypothetical protein
MFDQRTAIDEELRTIRSEVEELHGLVNMLTDEPAEVRDVWHWRWDGVMGRVDVLWQQYRGGQMTAEQSREFLRVSRMLTDGHIWIEALGCQIPLELSQEVILNG